MTARNVDDQIAGLTSWQGATVATLQREILAAGEVAETFKWGHPLWEAGGPICLVKAQKAHVTFGFWRGHEMAGLDPRLEPGGSFKMASIKLTGPGQITPDQVGRLVAAGIALNREKGDPLKRKP